MAATGAAVAEQKDDVVLAAAFSPCAKYLACATASGRLHVWSVPEFVVAPPTAVCSVQLHACAVYALVFAQTSAGTLLLSASDEEVRGWSWEHIVAQGTAGAPTLQLQNPRSSLPRGATGPLSETTAMCLDGSTLYSAAGDGNAYSWDLATQRCARPSPALS